jgi:hypothetical protein
MIPYSYQTKNNNKNRKQLGKIVIFFLLGLFHPAKAKSQLILSLNVYGKKMCSKTN